MKQIKIGIIGAGLTGLVAAKKLTEQGHHVVIFEKEATPGGRMRSEVVEGWILDRGFQVLLTAYPYLRQHVNLSGLALQELEAAATIFRAGKRSVVGDPFRTRKILWKTIFSDIGSWKDKWLIFQLKRRVDQLSIDEIFALPDAPTHAYLANFGFSHRIIQRFFQPFFGGIFLERSLSTSCRMFLFVFKMFAEGNAAIPAKGIGAVAQSLADELTTVAFHYNSSVAKVDAQTVHLANGETYSFDYVIQTIPVIGQHDSVENWQSCYNLYFEHTGRRIIQETRIGLIADPNSYMNNLFYPSVFQENTIHPDRSLLSVTVVDSQGKSPQELEELVAAELRTHFGLADLRCLITYVIPYALPICQPPKSEISFPVGQKTLKVGDFLLNGSQNAACFAGQMAAEHILHTEKQKPSAS
jgi:protoporphyrinogen oxidase